MRTPGHDIDLAIGFLLTEGIIRAHDDVRTAQLCAGDNEPNTYNVVDVTLADHVPAPEVDPTRNFYTTSSCGVCGKASIDAVRIKSAYDVDADATTVEATMLAELPDRLRDAQTTFASDRRPARGRPVHTGRRPGGGARGRRPAQRRRQGHRLGGAGAALPLAGHVLMVSGRASFELTQKASMAGIPMLAAVSAPSTLAVDLADEVGMTLVGFLRGPTMNVYTRPDRVVV